MRVESDSLAVHTTCTAVPRALLGTAGADDVRAATVDLLLADQRAADRRPSALDLWLVVDCSGSMHGTEPVLQRVLHTVAANLAPRDRMSVIMFNSNSRSLWPLQNPRADSERFAAAVASIKANGGTWIERGVERALAELAEQCRAGAYVAGQRLPSVLLLSDGATAGKKGDALVELVQAQLGELPAPGLVVSAIGFTRWCDVQLLRRFTEAGDAVGLFYFVQRDEDIDTAVGDCLGSLFSLGVVDVQLELAYPDVYSAFDDLLEEGEPKHRMPSLGFYNGDGAAHAPKRTRLGALGFGQRHSFVVVCGVGDEPDSNDYTDLTACLVRISFTPLGARHAITKEVVVSLDPLGANMVLAREAHCMTHVLRERTAHVLMLALQVAKTGNKEARDAVELQLEALLDELTNKLTLLQAADDLSEPANGASSSDAAKTATVLETAAVVSSSSSKAKAVGDKAAASGKNDAALSDAASIERMLTQDEFILDRCALSVGDAKSVLFGGQQQQQNAAPSFSNDAWYGVLLGAAHEHRSQQSPHDSAGAIGSGAYTTPAQLRMRLLFLSKFGQAGDHEVARKVKAAVALESGLTADERGREALALRRQVEDETVCFVSLDSWREADLGLGLVVFPRTNRERRRGLLPRVLLTGDVLSAKAFNDGVRTLVREVAPAQLDRDDEDNAEIAVVRGMSRTRINAWLPLFLNAEHWRHCSRFVKDAISLIATGRNQLFSPALAVSVMTKLLIQSIVQFTVFGDMSDRTLQQFCDVHRVFVQLSFENDEMHKLAAARLDAFITRPSARMRRETPDLGDLLFLLCISPEHRWRGALQEAFVIESVRRAAYQMGAAAKQIVRFGERTEAGKDDIDQLLDFWSAETSGGMVTSASIDFIDMVRPPDATLEEVVADIDRRWGRMNPRALHTLRQRVDDAKNRAKSVPQILSKLLDREMSREATAELLLYGFEHALCDEERRLPAPMSVPTGSGEYTARWRERMTLFQLAKQNPPPEVPVWPVGQSVERRALQMPRKKRMRAAVGPAVNELNARAKVRLTAQAALKAHNHAQRTNNSPPLPPCSFGADSASSASVHCACRRCDYNRAVAQRRIEWRSERSAAARANEQQHERTMFVGGLAQSVTESTLLDVVREFAAQSRVESALVVRDKLRPQKSKRYGFVCFASADDMMLAMRLLTKTASGGDLAPNSESTWRVQARESTIKSSFPALDDVKPAQVRIHGKPVVFDRVRGGRDLLFVPRHLR